MITPIAQAMWQFLYTGKQPPLQEYGNSLDLFFHAFLDERYGLNALPEEERRRYKKELALEPLRGKRTFFFDEATYCTVHFNPVYLTLEMTREHRKLVAKKIRRF